MAFATNGTPNMKGLEDKVEKLQELLKKRRWWETTWVQIIAFIGAVAGIVSLYTLFE
ncbi:MAG TPA: hypothetical protein VFQ72_01115 [Candidatus Paceibacterota bacterium]|nr:hypothetical protein [Candidatus Paceibacterota bacterium]